MKFFFVCIAFCLGYISSALPLPQQEIDVIRVDATVRPKERQHLPISGRGSGSGRKLPLEITMLPSGLLSAPQADHDFYVDFVVRNAGAEPIKLPVFVDSENLEPRKPNLQYSYEELVLLLIPDTGSKAPLQGGAHLYGSEDLSGSLITLNPKQSIRVRTKARMRANNGDDETNVRAFIGRMLLNTVTVRPMSGGLEEDQNAIGFADSQPTSLYASNLN